MSIKIHANLTSTLSGMESNGSLLEVFIIFFPCCLNQREKMAITFIIIISFEELTSYNFPPSVLIQPTALHF